MKTIHAVLVSLLIVSGIANAATAPVAPVKHPPLPVKVASDSVLPGHVVKLSALTPGGLLLLREVGGDRAFLVKRHALPDANIGQEFFYVGALNPYHSLSHLIPLSPIH